MVLDPNEYDLGELRTAAGLEEGRSGERRGGSNNGHAGADDVHAQRPRPQEAVRAGQYRELLQRERQAAPGDLEPPYLTGVPGSYTAVLVTFEWLDYLRRRGGEEGTLDALAYYERVGWLSADAAEELRAYLAGVDSPEGEPDDLSVEDHLVSLVYVTRLAALAARE